MQLPRAPFDGQVFIDAFRVKWQYNAEDNNWVRVGVVNDIPIARGTTDPNGPTNGLLSKKDKAILDQLSSKPGGFGFILKPGLHLTQENGPENVLDGDIKFISDSIAFECTEVSDGDCQVPAIKFNLSNSLLNSLCIEVAGKQGPTGDKGKKGREGRQGTGDGPKGETGEAGIDATERHAFTGIKYQELEQIWDTAVTNINLDSSNGVLEVTKAKMNVPEDDEPASKIFAKPVIRAIKFTKDDLSKWQLETGEADPAGEVDLNIIKLPKGWQPNLTNIGAGSLTTPSAVQSEPVPVQTVRLSTLVQAIINIYEKEAEKICKQWCNEIRDWIVERDKAARDVLHNLATQLAECQFQLPLEFCIGIEFADCTGLIGVLTDIAEGVDRIADNVTDIRDWLLCGEFERIVCKIVRCLGCSCKYGPSDLCSRNGGPSGGLVQKFSNIDEDDVDDVIRPFTDKGDGFVGQAIMLVLQKLWGDSSGMQSIAEEFGKVKSGDEALSMTKQIVDRVRQEVESNTIDICPSFSYDSRIEEKSGFDRQLDISGVLNCPPDENAPEGAEHSGVMQFKYASLGGNTQFSIFSKTGKAIFDSSTDSPDGEEVLVRVYDVDNPVKLVANPEGDAKYQFQTACTGICE